MFVFLWHNYVAPGCTQPCFDNFLFVFNFTVFGFHTEHNFRRKSTSSIIHLQQAPHTWLIPMFFLVNYTNLTYNWLGPAMELHCTQVHASRHKRISIRNCNLVYAWGKTYETWVQIQTFPLSHDGFGLLSIRQSIVRLQVLCDFSAHFEPVWTRSSICQPLTTLTITGQSWK